MDSSFSRIFPVACALFAIYAAAIAAIIPLGLLLIPVAHWAFPRWVRVSAARIEISDLASRPLRILIDDVESLSLVTESTTRRSLTVRWSGSERTVGLSQRVDANDLRALLGNKLEVTPRAEGS